MATATQIKELLKTHGEGDDERFYAIAMQVAAAEARQGHELLAQDLRHLVEKARMRKNQSGMDARIVHLAQPALTPNFRPRSGKYKVESAPFFSRLGGRQGRRFPLPSRSAARPRRGGPKGRGRSGATAAIVVICRSLRTGILRPASSCPAPSASFRCCSIRSTASVHGAKNVRRRRPWDRCPRTSPSTTGVR